jgi:CRP/FNR family transcriptional regulator, anaerobic regulatory protein
MEVSATKFNKLLDFFSSYIQLRPEEIVSVAGILQIATVKKNNFWVQEGEVCDRIGLILKGYARTYYLDHQQRDMTYEFVWEFNILVSLRSFIRRKPAVCSIVAMENMEVLYANYQDLMALAEKHPRFEALVKDLVSDNIPDIRRHTRLLQMISAQDRYEHLIATHPDIVKRVPLKHVASYLGISTETLSRVRGKKKQ